MLYRTIRRLIELGRTDGLREKMDIFLAAGSLTLDEYDGLAELLMKGM